MGDFWKKLRRAKITELLRGWKLLPAMMVAPFYRIKEKNLWIICEDPKEARDNGYFFFKYLREQHPEQHCVYAINKTSPDYTKVCSLGETVEYGSLRHWVLYLASKIQISSQKAGNPNAAVFYFLEVYGLLKNRRLFLQHGVTKDDCKWLYYDVTKMSRFVCGAYPEFEYVNNRFGYPKGSVCYTGMCRFDGLHSQIVDPSLILIMPTWREWIADEDHRLQEIEGTREISKTNYFVKWREFIQHPMLAELSEKYGVHFVFFPHRNMQKYMQYFPKSMKHIEIADGHKYEVQDLLKRASLMITDYSSVFFDFLYMKKPLIFYQFDYEQFRKGQYEEGYFMYKNNPFAKSYEDVSEVMVAVENSIQNHYSITPDYERAHADYFRLYDQNNSERVFRVAQELCSTGKRRV